MDFLNRNDDARQREQQVLDQNIAKTQQQRDTDRRAEVARTQHQQATQRQVAEQQTQKKPGR